MYNLLYLENKNKKPTKNSGAKKSKSSSAQIKNYTFTSTKSFGTPI